MNFLDKLERKLGRYALPNLTLYLIVCYAAGYILEFVNPTFMDYLTLDPYAILHGQVWRLLTWIVIPPYDFGFFTLITLYFYYSIGRSLESVWGTFRYNVFLISGMLFTTVAAFLLLGYYALINPQLVVEIVGTNSSFSNPASSTALAIWFGYIASLFSTYNICMSLFLAFAITFPEMRVLLMFFLPIKVKVLGAIYFALMAFQCLQYFGTPLFLPQFVAILSSILNVIIFFVVTRRGFRTPKQIRRQHAYKREINKVSSITKHRCAICGRTEVDSPNLTFRFCSKCEGNYEYCEEHLYTHRHVTTETE
ncbi:MAG: hypothetical protein J6P60_00330 [Lachnospiraceae bacterium]|nr:hypothetical protein [Lachnospiraceae bacterium]